MDTTGETSSAPQSSLKRPHPQPTTSTTKKLTTPTTKTTSITDIIDANTDPMRIPDYRTIPGLSIPQELETATLEDVLGVLRVPSDYTLDVRVILDPVSSSMFVIVVIIIILKFMI